MALQAAGIAQMLRLDKSGQKIGIGLPVVIDRLPFYVQGDALVKDGKVFTQPDQPPAAL